MRTLKRTLCLVLCLVMMLGLCVFNVGATSFSDDAEIDEAYDEAAEVLTTVGVFQGQDLDNDGSADAFGPKTELKRKEGAHLIKRLLLGINAATGVSSFSDVAAADSAEIALMEVLGITDGYGDGTFGPDDTLTGSMFAKWLSVCLGYSATDENMTGPEWEVGVAVLNKSLGLDNGIANYDPTAVLTREKAAQMCLNALQCTMVDYSGGVVVSEQGITLTAGGTRSYRTASNATGWAYAIDSDTDGTHPYVELGEWLYRGDLTLGQTVATSTDDFGRPSDNWSYKGSLIIKAPDTPVKVYTGRVGNANVIAADLGQYSVYAYNGTSVGTYPITTQPYTSLKTVGYIHTGNTGTLIATNGYYTNPQDAAYNKDTNPNPSNLYVNSSAAASLAEAIQQLTDNGKRVEIYADKHNMIEAIVVVEYTVNKITSITEDSNGTVAYAMSHNGTAYTYKDARHDTFNVAGGVKLAKGDYVTVTFDKTYGYFYAYPTTVVTGAQSAYSADNVTVDGTRYALAKGVFRNNSQNFVGGANEFEGNTTKDVNLYIDQYGYAVYRDEVITSADYAVVAKIAYPATGGVTAGDPQAQLVFSDGSKKTVTISKISKNGTKVTTTNNGDTAGVYIDNSISNVYTKNTEWNRIAKFTEKSNGEYEIDYNPGDFTTVGTSHAASTTPTYYALRAKFSYVGDESRYPANSDTIYIVRTGNNSFDVTTGFGNAPTIIVNDTSLPIYYQLDKNNKVVMVYFDKYTAGTKVTEYDNGTKDHIFYTWGKTVMYNNVGTMTYTIGGVLDGIAETYTLDSDTSLAPLASHTFYSVTVGNNDKLSDGTPYTFAKTGVVTSSIIDGITATNFNGFLVYSGTNVYLLNNSAQTSTKGDVFDISVGDAYYVQVGSGGNANRIDTLYIIKGAGGTVTTVAASDNGATAIANANAGSTLQGVVTVNSSTNVDKDITIDGTLDAEQAIDIKGGTTTVYGNIVSSNNSKITVEKGATLIVNGGENSTSDISAHIVQQPGSTVIITGDFKISGNSLILQGNATITGNIELTGLLVVYAGQNDANVKIDGDLTIGQSGSLQIVYNTQANWSANVTVTGKLTATSARGNSAGTNDITSYPTPDAAYAIYMPNTKESGSTKGSASLNVSGALVLSAATTDQITAKVDTGASFTTGGLTVNSDAVTQDTTIGSTSFKGVYNSTSGGYTWSGTAKTT